MPEPSSNDDYKKSPRSLLMAMTAGAYFLPACNLVAAIIRFIGGNRSDAHLLALLLLVLASIALGDYLHRRSKNRIAFFFVTKVEPGDWGPFDMALDWAAVALQVLLLSAFIFAPA